MTDPLLEGLDGEQRKAVLAVRGPVCIIAGAGTGKTRTITHRIAYAIRTGAVPASEVLAVTHSQKAAGEMRARLRQLGAGEVTARTFHSAALKQLRYFWARTGRSGQLQILDNRYRLIRRAMEAANQQVGQVNRIEVTNESVLDISSEISWAKSQLLTPGEYPTAARQAGRKVPGNSTTISKAYAQYEALKGESTLDFEDILAVTAELILSDAAVADEVRAAYTYFVVDEYQDTDPLQDRLLTAWLGDRDDICVVGDHRQCVPVTQTVQTPDGPKLVEEFRGGDLVLSSQMGRLVPRTVERVERSIKENVLRFRTATGSTFEASADHTLFAALDGAGSVYVYLMYRSNYGFRVGTTKLPRRSGPAEGAGWVGMRTLGESAERMWILGVFDTEQEARRYEQQLAYRYQVPMATFKRRPGTAFESQEQIREFFEEFSENGHRILEDFGLDFDRAAFVAKASGSSRVVVNVILGAKEGVRVEVESGLITSDQKERFGFTNGKYGQISRLRRYFANPRAAYDFLKELKSAINCDIVETLSLPRSSEKRRPRTFATLAAGVFPGMLVPEADPVTGEVSLVPVVDRESVAGAVECADLQVSGLANFVVGNVVVHNCVYSFKGAQPRFVHDFPKRWPHATVVQLVKDYRSTPQVVDLATRLVREKPGSLLGQRPNGPAVVITEQYDEASEEHWVANRIQQLIRSGVSPSEIAVLYRFNSQAARFEQALGSAGIPYVVADTEKFYDRPEVRAILVEFGKLAREEPEEVGVYHLRLVLAESGWDRENPPPGAGAARDRWEALAALLGIVESMPDCETLGASYLLAELQHRAMEQHAPSQALVTLSTIHKSKGLEWDAVFVVRCTDGSLPSTYATTSEQVEEERRLMYVAATRAREHLHLSYAQRNEKKWTLKPSRFLVEIGEAATPATRNSRRPSRSPNAADDERWDLPSRAAKPTSGKPWRPGGPYCEVCDTKLGLRILEENARCGEHLLGEAKDCYDRLAAWRAQAAKGRHNNPQDLLSDAQLLAIVALQPKTEAVLVRVPNIGSAKRTQWGAQIVEVVTRQ